MTPLYKTHPLEGVQDRRQLLKVRAVDLAAAIGMETASFRRMERGERRCYLDKALILAKMLACTPEELGVIPDDAERLRLFGISESRRALAESGVDLETQAAIDALNRAFDDGVEIEERVPSHPVVLNAEPPAPEPEPAPAAEPSDDEHAAALARITDQWEQEDAELINIAEQTITTKLADFDESTQDDSQVVLVTEGVTQASGSDDDEPELPTDPMAKYVSTWTGDTQ